MAGHAELACAYCAFILSDHGTEISAANIEKILKAARVSVDRLWLNIFAKALKSVDVKEVVNSCSSASGSPGVAAAPAPSTTQTAPETTQSKKEEKKEESEDEDDGDMGFGLFD